MYMYSAKKVNKAPTHLLGATIPASVSAWTVSGGVIHASTANRSNTIFNSANCMNESHRCVKNKNEI